MSVTSSAASSRKTSETSLDWEELSQSINTFGLEEEQVI